MLELHLDLPVHVAVIEFEDLRLEPAEGAFRALEACAERYRATYAADGPAAPGAVAGAQAARDLFRALGIDATKRRPSSEALLNRALKGKSLPLVNPLVDVGNWCSLDFLLPLGIYDTDAIAGPVVLRRGAEGERYETIGARTMSLDGRYVLADDEGPFGSPITDSVRTSVSARTTRAVVLVYAPAGYDTTRLREHAEILAERVSRFCGGRTTAIDLRSGS